MIETPQIIRRDSPRGRFYDIDGVEYPSVTHILQVISKPALIQWAATTERTLVSDVSADLYRDLSGTPPLPRAAYLTTLQARIGKQRAHARELAKASEIGTQVHALVEWNLRRSLGQRVGPEPRVLDDAQWAFMACQDWQRSAQLEPLLIEQTVFHRRHGYAGTMDLLAKVKGVPMLIDFKTGKAVYEEAFLQNAAYQAALEDMGHGQVVGGLIVRLPKLQTDPAFEVVPVPPRDELLPIFHAAIVLWRWWHANEQASRARWEAKQALNR